MRDFLGTPTGYVLIQSIATVLAGLLIWWAVRHDAN